MYAVNIKNVSKKYNGSVEAVKNLSLKIGGNQTVALIGESGCGKSTLINLLLGTIQPDTGSIFIKSEGVQAVFQNSVDSLDPRWTVERSISEPLIHLMHLNKHIIHDRVIQLLHLVELSADYALRFPHELSGGEQKRVCIARAIASNPKLLLLDEAVSGLDAITQKKILDLLIKIKNKLHCSCLFITHDINMALYFSDVIAVMKDGVIVEIKSNGGGEFCHPYSQSLIKNCLSKAILYDRLLPSGKICEERRWAN